MPWKDIEKQREAIRKHYYANKAVYIERAMRRRKELRTWLYEYKASQPCTDCDIRYPHYVLDFDHIGLKNAEINKIINTGNAKRLKAEILLCEIVCSNCHRERTQRRQIEKSKV
jgi:hypothetical protein